LVRVKFEIQRISAFQQDGLRVSKHSYPSEPQQVKNNLSKRTSYAGTAIIRNERNQLPTLPGEASSHTSAKRSKAGTSSKADVGLRAGFRAGRHGDFRSPRSIDRRSRSQWVPRRRCC